MLRGGATGGGLRAAVSGRARGHLRAALLGPLHLGRGEHGGFLRVLRAALLILRALGLLGHLLGGPLIRVGAGGLLLLLGLPALRTR